jgi:uncharacterized protein with HEPN domain
LAEEFQGLVAYDVFKNDHLRLYAVTRCLEIISEASRRLPDELKARHPSIDWREMAAAGNVYRHEYEDLAAQAIWRTMVHDLPQLRIVIEQELARIGE